METITTDAPLNQLELERTWMRALSRHIAGWDAAPVTRGLTCYKAKRFVTWKVVDGRPQIIDAWVVDDVQITTEGPEMTLRSSKGPVFVVDHKPRELGPLLFAWLPAFLDTRYAPRDYHDPHSMKYRQLTWRFCTRQAADARRAIKPDVVYFSDVREFTKIWPEFTF